MLIPFQNTHVSQVCEKFVQSQLVHLRFLLMGMTQLTPFHDQTQGSFHSQHFLRLPELPQLRG